MHFQLLDYHVLTFAPTADNIKVGCKYYALTVWLHVTFSDIPLQYMKEMHGYAGTLLGKCRKVLGIYYTKWN